MYADDEDYDFVDDGDNLYEFDPDEVDYIDEYDTLVNEDDWREDR